MSNILITGGLGFIGSRFVNLCNKKGHDVTIIDKYTYAADLDRIDFHAGYFNNDIWDITEGVALQARRNWFALVTVRWNKGSWY